MKEFIAGFRYVFAGFSLIKEKSVRAYVLIPLSINIILFSLGLWYAIGEFSSVINWLEREALPDQLDVPGWLAWVNSIYVWIIGLLGWLRYLLWGLFFIVYLLMVFYTFTLVANLISSPFNGFFSAAIERLLLGEEDPGHVERTVAEEIRLSIKSEAQKLLYNLKCLIPLLLVVLILLVTYIGQPLIPLLWFAFGALMFSIEYTGYPLGNHGYLFKAHKAKVQEYRSLTLGFGSGITLMTMIPILNFFAVPVGVAGATKLYVDKMKAQVDQEKQQALEHQA